MGIPYPILFLGLAIFGYATITSLRWRYRGTGLDLERLGEEAIDRLRESDAAKGSSPRSERDDPA